MRDFMKKSDSDEASGSTSESEDSNSQQSCNSNNISGVLAANLQLGQSMSSEMKPLKRLNDIPDALDDFEEEKKEEESNPNAELIVVPRIVNQIQDDDLRSSLPSLGPSELDPGSDSDSPSVMRFGGFVRKKARKDAPSNQKEIRVNENFDMQLRENVMQKDKGVAKFDEEQIWEFQQELMNKQMGNSDLDLPMEMLGLKSKKKKANFFSDPKEQQQKDKDALMKFIKPKDHECTCAEIMLVDCNDAAHFPIKQVINHLFKIKHVDQASTVDEAIQLIKDRVTRTCCKKRYLLIITNYHL